MNPTTDDVLHNLEYAEVSAEEAVVDAEAACRNNAERQANLARVKGYQASTYAFTALLWAVRWNPKKQGSFRLLWDSFRLRVAAKAISIFLDLGQITVTALCLAGYEQHAVYIITRTYWLCVHAHRKMVRITADAAYRLLLRAKK